MKDVLSPLHNAVLHDDYQQVQILSLDVEQLYLKDSLGFSALEIAQFLGKHKSVMIIDPDQPYNFPKIKVVLRKYHRIIELNPWQFASNFGVHYRSHLFFPSYDALKNVVRNCPWILRTRLGDDQRDLAVKYQNELSTGFFADVVIKWIDDDLGYGLFAEQDLPANAYVGEYVGMVRPLLRRDPDTNPYCMHYPTRWWSWNFHVIDSLESGNALRFVNHSDEPNVDAQCALDRGILHPVFVTNRPVNKGEELLFDYGVNYWRNRRKL